MLILWQAIINEKDGGPLIGRAKGFGITPDFLLEIRRRQNKGRTVKSPNKFRLVFVGFQVLFNRGSWSESSQGFAFAYILEWPIKVKKYRVSKLESKWSGIKLGTFNLIWSNTFEPEKRLKMLDPASHWAFWHDFAIGQSPGYCLSWPIEAKCCSLKYQTS